jgi:hypothetical protein
VRAGALEEEMSLWSRLFGDRVKRAGGDKQSRVFSERDNVGTRYETSDKVLAFWQTHVKGGSNAPVLMYHMRDRKSAMNAMLSLPPIQIAHDSGKLISTEVLQFGVYPTPEHGDVERSWGFVLAGQQMTPELYEAAVASCKKVKGIERVNRAPSRAAAANPGGSVDSSGSSKPSPNRVTFDRDENVDMLELAKTRGVPLVGSSGVVNWHIKCDWRGFLAN